MKVLRNKWVLLIGAVVIIGGLFLASQRGQGNVDSAAAETGETAVAFVGALAESATASGKVTAPQSASLSFLTTGVVETVNVSVGDVVAEGDVLMALETEALSRNVASAEADVVIAEANLANLQAPPTSANLASAQAAIASAQARLDDLLAGPSEEAIRASEASVAAAEANVVAASGNLTAVFDVDEGDILSAEAELQSAIDAQTDANNLWVRFADCELNENGVHTCTADDSDLMAQLTDNVAVANAQVALAQARLDGLSSPDSNSVAAQQASLAGSQASYEAAVAQHEALLLGASDDEIASAEADLANAQAALATLVDGPSATDITIFETRVAQAQTSLKEAQNALEKATLVAPFDGVVTAVGVGQGEQAAGAVVELVNMSALEVILNVDEIDIGQLRLGQPAIITLETWPDEELESSITAIAPSANQDPTGIVSYDVHLGLTDTELPVLIGMTANANLITANREDVLLVPNSAITADRENDSYTVELVGTNDEGAQTTTTVEVSIGLRDGDYTQITDGLQAGDEIVIGQLNAPLFDFGGPPDDQ